MRSDILTKQHNTTVIQKYRAKCNGILNLILLKNYENQRSAIFSQCNILCGYLHNMPNADHA